MIHYSTAAEANRKVEATSTRTIKRMPFDLAKRISTALSEPPDPMRQSKGENAALSSLISQEDREIIPVQSIMLKLLRTVVYRALRAERARLERLGVPKVTVEALHDARLYGAGYIAGYAEANRMVAKKAIDISKDLSYIPDHDESIRNCDVQDE